mmetsp:Transcript_12283/g.29546  ORF Transcript_12283/g.29546 Transcript_12283/m.29546 type:complete len:121 (-) Transcript_12283:262-624(-)
MNLGYLWKALYNERVISAVDDWWRENVLESRLLWFWRDRRKNMRKVQAVDQDQSTSTDSRGVTGNAMENGGGSSGKIYNDGGMPMNGDNRRRQQQHQQQQRRRRPGNDDSAKYMDNHIRY